MAMEYILMQTQGTYESEALISNGTCKLNSCFKPKVSVKVSTNHRCIFSLNNTSVATTISTALMLARGRNY